MDLVKAAFNLNMICIGLIFDYISIGVYCQHSPSGHPFRTNSLNHQPDPKCPKEGLCMHHRAMIQPPPFRIIAPRAEPVKQTGPGGQNVPS